MAVGVLEWSFGVDWRIYGVPNACAGEPEFFRRFIPAGGSYLAQAVLGERPDIAVGQLVEGALEGTETSRIRDVAVTWTAGQSAQRKQFHVPSSQSSNVEVSPYPSRAMPCHPTSVQPSTLLSPCPQINLAAARCGTPWLGYFGRGSSKGALNSDRRTPCLEDEHDLDKQDSQDSQNSQNSPTKSTGSASAAARSLCSVSHRGGGDVAFIQLPWRSGAAR